MKLIAILINYYTGKFLSPLLDVLQKEALIEKIFVFDNSKEQEILEYSENYSKVKIIISEINVGFAAGVNAITSQHHADYYLLINPDTLPTKEFSKKLFEAAEKYKALVSGPRFYWDDDKSFRLSPAVGNSLIILNSLKISQQSYSDAQILTKNWAVQHDSFWNNEIPFSQPFLSGACLLIKNDPLFFHDGKIFDDRFFLYYEDTDLCIRAMLENQPVICVPDAEVVHYWDQSPSDNKHLLMRESHKKFFDKHYPKYILNDQYYKSFPDKVKLSVDYIGEFNDSPIFTYNKIDYCEDRYFFEIGLNPVFVPFAQCWVKETTYLISPKLWNMMKPGIYFSRIRTGTNQVIKIWKWKKL